MNQTNSIYLKTNENQPKVQANVMVRPVVRQVVVPNVSTKKTNGNVVKRAVMRPIVGQVAVPPVQTTRLVSNSSGKSGKARIGDMIFIPEPDEKKKEVNWTTTRWKVFPIGIQGVSDLQIRSEFTHQVPGMTVTGTNFFAPPMIPVPPPLRMTQKDKDKMKKLYDKKKEQARPIVQFTPKPPPQKRVIPFNPMFPMRIGLGPPTGPRNWRPPQPLPCSKGRKRRPWQEYEDYLLKELVAIHERKWSKISSVMQQKGVIRDAKQCRERYTNSLDPTLNFGDWTEEEDLLITKWVTEYGTKWTRVQDKLATNRSVNMIKNRWYAHLDPNRKVRKRQYRGRKRKRKGKGSGVDEKEQNTSEEKESSSSEKKKKGESKGKKKKLKYKRKSLDKDAFGRGGGMGSGFHFTFEKRKNSKKRKQPSYERGSGRRKKRMKYQR